MNDIPSICGTKFAELFSLDLGNSHHNLSSRSTALLELSVGSTVFLSTSQVKSVSSFKTKLPFFEYLGNIYKWEKLHLQRQTWLS